MDHQISSEFSLQPQPPKIEILTVPNPRLRIFKHPDRDIYDKLPAGLPGYSWFSIDHEGKTQLPDQGYMIKPDILDWTRSFFKKYGTAIEKIRVNPDSIEIIKVEESSATSPSWEPIETDVVNYLKEALNLPDDVEVNIVENVGR